MIINIAPTYANSLAVKLPEYDGFWNSGIRENPVYSGIRFGSDGKIYRNTRVGAWQWTGQSWLVSGAATGYYLQWSIVSGSALANSETDLSQMNANLDFNVTSAFIRKTTDILFTIADDTLGAVPLVSRTYRLDCERPVEFDKGNPYQPSWGVVPQIP